MSGMVGWLVDLDEQTGVGWLVDVDDQTGGGGDACGWLVGWMWINRQKTRRTVPTAQAALSSLLLAHPLTNARTHATD